MKIIRSIKGSEKGAGLFIFSLHNFRGTWGWPVDSFHLKVRFYYFFYCIDKEKVKYLY